MDKKLSYTAASTIPWKLLRKSGEILRTGGIIRPHHLQLFLTNRCNANCAWCSCKNSDRKQELTTAELLAIVGHFRWLGTKAVTVTGGGEPTLHPGFREIMKKIAETMQIGLVTNGLKVSPEKLRTIDETVTWVRLSIVDSNLGATAAEWKPPHERVREFAQAIPTVDFGVSFTISREVDLEKAVNIAKIADEIPNLTHIRYVEDIVGLATEQTEQVAQAVYGVTDKAIIQRRAESTRGAPRCLISKLKPVVAADGYVYPCCGVQYARGGKDQDLEMAKSFRMCHWKEFDYSTFHFDGTDCAKCYYGDYNRALDILSGELEHEDFV